MSELPEGVHPAQPPEPDQSALAIVLQAAKNGAWELLLGLRSARAHFLPGHLAFPGGRLEPGDRPAEPGAYARCASRELLEETGLTVPPEAWLDAGERVTPPLFPSRFRTRFLLAELRSAGLGRGLTPANEENERLVFAVPRDVLAEWERGGCRVAPPLLPILRAVAQESGISPSEVARRIAAVNTEQERAPLVEFFPGISMVPVRTATLPPATHTNVWLAGGTRFAVIDPGSPEPEELRLLLEVIERRRRLGHEPVALLLTHGHRDHSGGAPSLSRALGIPIRAHPAVLKTLERTAGLPAAEPLDEGDTIDLDGLSLQTLLTPGHAPGHLAFYVPERRLLIGGDLLSGLSTILVDPRQGGDMETYVASLERVRRLDCLTVLPGHGPPQPAAELVRAINHRVWREARILEHLALGPASLSTLARQAYAEVPQIHPALAEAQTLAHLVWLERRGQATRRDAAGMSWSPPAAGSSRGGMEGTAALIERILRERFRPLHLELRDDSSKHAGHPGAASGGGHYHVLIVSAAFEGQSRLKQHRMVNAALQELLGHQIHALGLKTLAPVEWEG